MKLLDSVDFEQNYCLSFMAPNWAESAMSSALKKCSTIKINLSAHMKPNSQWKYHSSNTVGKTLVCKLNEYFDRILNVVSIENTCLKSMSEVNGESSLWD